jgi:ubiquinone biosynthesis protein COQ4
MPANTFGAAYAQFMGSRNFSPDDRPPVRFLESEELAYVATRAREVISFPCLVYWFKKSKNIKSYL